MTVPVCRICEVALHFPDGCKGVLVAEYVDYLIVGEVGGDQVVVAVVS